MSEREIKIGLALEQGTEFCGALEAMVRTWILFRTGDAIDGFKQRVAISHLCFTDIHASSWRLDWRGQSLGTSKVNKASRELSQHRGKRVEASEI